MVDALIKISGSLFVGGFGLIMIVFSILITVIAIREIINHFDNKNK